MQDRRDYQETAHNLNFETCKRMNDEQERIAQLEEKETVVRNSYES